MGPRGAYLPLAFMKVSGHRKGEDEGKMMGEADPKAVAKPRASLEDRVAGVMAVDSQELLHRVCRVSRGRSRKASTSNVI